MRDQIRESSQLTTSRPSRSCRVRSKDMPAVFISYRRRDSAPYARDIKRHLETRFGPDSVFMDVEIGAGHDFRVPD
jgi:hypothetical protein